MSLPKEPRQLMINLMYLVLTALLALNVSNEILHAFRVINQSISESNNSIRRKNEETYKNFNDAENQEGMRERVKPYNDKAKEVRDSAQALFDYLTSWQNRIIEESGGYDSALGQIKREDNIDASTLLLVNHNGGDTLKAKINRLRTFMLSVLSPADRTQLESLLPLKVENPKKTENNPHGDWTTGYFYNMPSMAAVTLFSKFQNDVRNSEQLVVNKLFEEAYQSQLKFDAIQAIAVPKTSYALAGQKVEAQIMLAAYNKSIQPAVSASSGHISKVQDGVAYWESTASGVGLQTVRGTVSLDIGGRKIQQNYDFQYMVGSTGASMQLDKMNVFYIGVPNPITVSAAGYSLEDVSVNIPGATITPDPTTKGHYNIMVTQPGKVMADIMAKTPEGLKRVGGQEIRIKTIPDPVAKIGGKSYGYMQTNIFKGQLAIIAVLENFDFDAKFIVTSYAFSLAPKHGDLMGPFTENSPYLQGPHLGNKQVEQMINRAKPGDKVFFEDIKAIGPDKKQRSLGSITLTLL